jgi:hypothetical protein
VHEKNRQHRAFDGVFALHAPHCVDAGMEPPRDRSSGGEGPRRNRGHGATLIDDVKNFTNSMPTIQIDEIVEPVHRA